MKCTRCGKEMTIKPVQSGTDESGEPVFTRYAFCYDCKIKVNLDKQKERDNAEKSDGRRCGRDKNKEKEKEREKASFCFVSEKTRRKRKDENEERKTRRRIAQVLTLSDRCCGTWICSIYLSASNCKIRTADV